MRHFKRWGVMYVLGLMWAVSTFVHYSGLRDVVKDEAAAHEQPFNEDEFRSEFIASTFENWQSEFMQLFVQAGLVVGMANVLFRKSQEDIMAIKEAVGAE